MKQENKPKPLPISDYLNTLNLYQLNSIQRLAKERADRLREEDKVVMWRVGCKGWNAFVSDDVRLAVAFLQEELSTFAEDKEPHFEIEKISVFPSEVASIKEDFKYESDRLIGKIKNEKPASLIRQPVAWQIEAKRFCGEFTSDKEVADHWVAKGAIVTPLYAARQSANPVAWRVWLEELGLWSLSSRYHGCGEPLYALDSTPSSSPPPSPPLFWVRFVSGGEGHEAPILHSAMRQEDIESGRYTPLFSMPPSGESDSAPFIPKTVEEMRDFIGMNFDGLQYAEPDTQTPHEMDRYTLTIHDLLSAFSWAGHYDENDSTS